jgi:hypothetical protein
MARGMDWRKARKFKASESKETPGTVLANGAIVPHPVVEKYSFQERAKYVERQWLKRSGLDENLKPRSRR